MPTPRHSSALKAPHIRLGRAGHFFALTKPRVMSLAIFTAITGMALAPGEMSAPSAMAAILAIAGGAGAAGALNMWYDAPLDRQMARTARRPIPAGQVAPQEALAFGLALAVLSVAALAIVANGPSAALLAATIAFYAVIYTMWLKHRTPQNIVIGGAAGALPPVIGWATVSGSLDWRAGLLFLIILIWTPPHFWALALMRSGDYARARIPMLTVVAGEAATRRQILGYALVLAPLGVAPWSAGLAGPAYGLAALILGAEFIRRALALHAAPPGARGEAKALFSYSILYLFAIFAGLLIDAGAARLTAGV
ncbi:MAG: heme o synthase [Pseudomonadota bacterium]